MPNKDSGFHSVSFDDLFLELVDRIGPKVRAKPQDGRRRDSRALVIEFLVRKAIKDLEDQGLLPRQQVSIEIYDEPRVYSSLCRSCGYPSHYPRPCADRESPRVDP
jgi:hypothetical protein